MKAVEGFYMRMISIIILLSLAVGSAYAEKATFAAGCFWGVQEFFRNVPGVTKTQVGYSGGTMVNPSYHQVSSGTTGHAETVEIEFDPKKVSYEQLLVLFFKMHDPTTLNQQGNDRGTQYRSAIFVNSDKQKQVAEALKAKVEKSQAWHAPVMTEITRATKFYPAEAEHQNYLQINKGGYDNHHLRDLSFDTPAK